MTDMQRYALTSYEWDADAWLAPADDGIWVLASDAEAAIAAAEQRGFKDASDLCDGATTGYWRGQRDMLAKCIAAVENTYTVSFVTLDADFQRAALAALRALEEKP